ncbi:hypothetical protein PybrP1_007208 [[Pythium] brassicae (nom. inval.)]|nr:hypothetical protein PybrP1_007208 [[Pythium] brassicae (nom. inval.)]
MSGSSSAVASAAKPPPKHLWSPAEVAELTAAAVAAMPASLSHAAASLAKKSAAGARRPDGAAALAPPVATAAAHNHSHHHHHHHGGGSLPPPLGAAAGALSAVSSGESAASASFQGDLNKIDLGLNSDDADVQLEAAKKLRGLLSSERDLLIRQMLDKNWTPRLIKWLRLRDRPTLQVEALWALTNIAAGATDNTSVLLQNGVIPTLVSLLDSSNEEVLEQSVWVLGNLAGEGSATRDLVLNAGALVPLVNNLKKTPADRSSLLRILTWTLSNLCDGQPRPVFDISIILPSLAKMLTSADTEILSHVCWAFSHLCDGPSTHIQAVVDSDVCFRLVELLGHSSWRVTKPALRAIGNIVCAEDDHDYTQHIIECGAVPSLRRLIAHSNREIQKEACWTLSNIAAGTVDQIQCVLDSGCIPSLMGLAASDATDAEVKSEACWVVLNATSCGSDSQIEYLVNEGCIQILGNLLEETSMVMMALEGLERILQVGELEAKRTDAPNPYASLMASANIETLVSHKSATVAKRASRIWQQHFVTCAICMNPFSKHASDTFFCDECKCNVCKHCDCTVFHLKYQESLWQEETEKETHEKQAKQASKRNKRQRKRQRTRKRKAALLRTGGGAGNGPSSNNSGSGGAGGGSNGELQHKTPARAAARRKKAAQGAAAQAGGGATPAGATARGKQGNGQPGSSSSASSSEEDDDNGSASRSRTASSNRNRGDSDSDDDDDDEDDDDEDDEDEDDEDDDEEPDDATASAEEEELASGLALDEMVSVNDMWVSYLMKTGSIMALAERLDLEDDSLWTVAEKDRTAIHA